MYAKTVFFIVALGGSAYLAGKTLIDESVFNAASLTELFSSDMEETSVTSVKSDDQANLHSSISALQAENAQLKDSILMLNQALSSLQKMQTSDVKPEKFSPSKKVEPYDVDIESSVLENDFAGVTTDLKSLQNSAFIEGGNNTAHVDTIETVSTDKVGVSQERAKRLQQLAELRDLSTKRQLAAISALAK